LPQVKGISLTGITRRNRDWFVRGQERLGLRFDVLDLRVAIEVPDPMQPLLWTARSLCNLTRELAKKGHKVCPTRLRGITHLRRAAERSIAGLLRQVGRAISAFSLDDCGNFFRHAG
jgi:hypothetical protein